VDNFQNTAGDIALSFNDVETYTAVRNAGIRAGASYFGDDVLQRVYYDS
jgi:hypothetical protein